MTPGLVWLFVALAVAVGLLIVSVLHYRYWVARFTVELDYSFTQRFATEDGSSIVLRRIPIPDGVELDGALPPVLLVHGLAFNHRNYDMFDDLSLGRSLARAGRDVWLLTLRSGRTDVSLRESRLVTFARMAEFDLGLGVREVLSRTGSDALDYVGFSMGGMLLYAAAGRFVEPGALRRVAIVGSPARLDPPFPLIGRAARTIPGWLVPSVPLRASSRMLAFALEWVETPIHHWIYNPSNVDKGVAARSVVNGFVNIPASLAREMVRWQGEGGVVQFDGEPITKTLESMKAPALFVAGARDFLAPPESVQTAYEAWGATDKEMTVLSIDGGAAADYGHGDLVIGRFAPEEVFDPVVAFLAK